MILTAEEYARGYIDFDAVLPEGCAIELWTKTTDYTGEESEWAGPYTNPKGSKVLSPPKPMIKLCVGLSRGDDPSQTPILNKVRWERDGRTCIWPSATGFVGNPGALVLGRDYGVSYRLVFQSLRATWPEALVIIGRNIRIRFWKGSLKGHKVAGFHDAEPTPEGNFSVEGSIEEAEVEGDMVEVLATIPGNNEEQVKEEAKNHVESIVGLLALCYGEQILGQPIFSEYYYSSATSEEGCIHVPVKHLVSVSVDNNLAPLADNTLTKLYDSIITHSIGLALRWYTTGLKSDSPVDKYIAYFVGLEALASGYFASIEPRPVREQHTQLTEYFVRARPPIDQRLKEIVLSLTADFTLSMKFSMYWKSRFNQETQESRAFSQFNRLRNELLHGRALSVTSQQVNSVKQLLEKLLAKELGLDNVVTARQSGPILLEFALSYILLPSRERANH